MIRRDGDRQKRTKNLLPNPPTGASASATAGTSCLVGSQRQMLRDIRESLSHLRKEGTVPLSSVSSSAQTGVTSSGAVSSSLCNSAGAVSPALKPDLMQIKAEFLSMNAGQQGIVSGVGGGTGGGGNAGGVVLSGSNVSNSNDSRATNAVKSARYGYRQKALAEIRNSLLPFANSDRHGNQHEASSASSTTSESSSQSQIPGSGGCASVASGSSASSGPNGLDKELIVQRQLLQQLLAAGYSEESALRVLKLATSKLISEVVGDQASKEMPHKLEPINGFVRPQALANLNMKPSRKQSLQDGMVRDGQSPRRACSPATDGIATGSRSDSPGVAGLHPHVHSQLVRQQSPSFPAGEPPPPPPPPRGVSGPPPTPPPLPPSPASLQQLEFRPAQFGPNPNSGHVSGQVQQLLKRMSPVPHGGARAQVVGYAPSSVSSSSTPQTGTSPVPFNRVHLVSNASQQQLVQQLQALNMYSSGASSSSRSDPPPPYPSSSTHSPLSSIYSPPSYASSSSGRQSPTPTISSSEYSIPPAMNIQLQKRTPPPAYTPPSSAGSPQLQPPPAHVNAPAVTAATVVTSIIPRPIPLQAWSARQAKSQSPIIMQSVKSTQVQKPVLQTAIAPTSPPVNVVPPSFASSPAAPQAILQQSHAGPGSYHSTAPNASGGLPLYVTSSQNVTTQSHSTSVPIAPSYPSSVTFRRQAQPGQTPQLPQYSAAQPSQVVGSPMYLSTVVGANQPPPYMTTVHQQLTLPSYSMQMHNQNAIQQDTVSAGSPGYSNPPPSYAASIQSQNIIRQEPAPMPANSAGGSNAFPLTVHNQSALWPDGARSVVTGMACTQLQPQMATAVQIPTTVPTTEPPSYASSVAALAAQRAAAGTVSSLCTNVPSFAGGTGHAHASAHPAASSTTTASSGTTPSGTAVTNRTQGFATAAAPSPSVITSNLVNTVESICTSQVSVLQGANSSLPRTNLNNLQGEFSVFNPQLTPLQRKPSPVAMDTASSASRSASRSESPVSHGMSQSPVSFMSTASTSSPSTQSDLTHDSGRIPLPSPGKTTHQSPIPLRKVLSKEKEDERRETKVRNYSPAAFKFFMEQHVENLLKTHQQREHRRQQLETEMAKVGLSEEAQCQMRRMLHQKESNYIRLKRAKMDKSMFKKTKTIGVGAFGEVALVRKVDTNQLYAMKTLRKTDVLKRNQVAHVKAERDILAEADNEWVVKLYYSFQDKDNLYFVMDYIPGGDLMSLLIKFSIFQEPLARFYIAELILAVESVHKMGFIHRDIKPDNILIDRDGHIKLTDFGLCTGFRWTHNSKYYQRNGEHSRQDSMDPDENWSNECHCNASANLKPLERRRRREHQRCLAHSLVGTPNYIAPEVLLRTGYTQLCDWWSVGVILYEMLVGQPPFLANTPAETQYKVINWESTLHIPKAANLSTEATDLVLKLCCGPDKRSGRNGAEEIKAHPFFVGIDLEGGLRKQPAPYIPRIRYATDTSNFDPVDPEKLKNGSDSSTDSKSEEDYENGKHPEHAFFEFTFRRFFDDGGQAYPMRISVDDNDNQGSPVYV